MFALGAPAFFKAAITLTASPENKLRISGGKIVTRYKIRAMLAGTINLLEDTGKSAPTNELKGLADNLQSLQPILEQEINTVILSCTRARRQLLAETRLSKPTVH